MPIYAFIIYKIMVIYWPFLLQWMVVPFSYQLWRLLQLQKKWKIISNITQHIHSPKSANNCLNRSLLSAGPSPNRPNNLKPQSQNEQYTCTTCHHCPTHMLVVHAPSVWSLPPYHQLGPQLTLPMVRIIKPSTHSYWDRTPFFDGPVQPLVHYCDYRSDYLILSLELWD